MKIRITGMALAAILALAFPASAEAGKASAIEVTQPWARASAGAAKMGAAYLTLHNAGPAADRLVSASTPASASVEMHTVLKDGDILRMRPVAAIDIAAGSTTKLQPGGYHLMLMGLKAPLKTGDHFPLELKFEHGGTRTVEVQVGQSVDAPEDHGGHHR